MMSLGKDQVPNTETKTTRDLDLLSMLDVMAQNTLDDVSIAFCSDDVEVDDDEAPGALNRIKARMQMLRIVIRNIK